MSGNSATPNLNGESARLCIIKPVPEGVWNHPLHLALTRPKGPQDTRPYTIRPMRFADTYQCAFIASRAYHANQFTEFLSPGRRQYPQDYVRGFQQRITSRLLCANNRSWVAVTEDDVPVAHVQCERLGDDEGAKAVVKEKKTLWLSICQIVFDAWVKVSTKIWPDRSGMDEESMAVFMASNDEEYKRHWADRPDRANRWYCRSMVVSPEFQRRGIGKALMMEIIKRAEAEGLPVQLEASPDGELLYRSLGFELLDRFMIAFGEAERNRGGVMMWSPKKNAETAQATGVALEEQNGSVLRERTKTDQT